jgi:hypothetical protein
VLPLLQYWCDGGFNPRGVSSGFLRREFRSEILVCDTAGDRKRARARTREKKVVTRRGLLRQKGTDQTAKREPKESAVFVLVKSLGF